MRRMLLNAFMALATTAQAAPEINQASLAELESLNGLGTSTTRRILDARQKGPFQDWADLIARVQGMGPGNAARLSAAGLTVNGRPYEANASAATPRRRSEPKPVSAAASK